MPTTRPPARLIHDGLPYRNEDEFASALVPWLREGIESGAAAVVATTQASIARLRQTLGADASHVSFFPNDDWHRRPARTVAAWGRVLREAAERGATSARLVGEVWFGSTPAEQAAWTRFESILNGALADADAWIVCPYDVRTLPERVVDDAWRTHPTMWDGPRRDPSERYVEPEEFLRMVPEALPELGEPGLRAEIGGDLGRLRADVRRLAATVLDPTQTEELVLAFGEVAANALRYGEPPRTVWMWTGAEGVVCEVSDSGQAVLGPLAGFRPPVPGSSSGLGLWIARQLTDWLTIDRTPEGATAVRFGMAGEA